MAINPGYAGSNDMICATALNRQQWVSIPGNPTTSVFNVNAPFNLFGISSAAGLNFINDNIGFNTDLSFMLNYAVRINAGSGKLGIGVGAGIVNPSIKPEWSEDLPTSFHQDRSIPEGDESDVVFDLNFGFFYRTEDLFVGFSATHLNAPQIEYQGSTEGNNSTLNLNRHFYLVSGYNFQLSNPAFEIKPTFLIQTDTRSTSFDVNARLEYNKKLWGGVSYRLAQASSFIGMIGIELFNGVKIGYAYDLPSQDLRNFSSGSHELMVGYCFNLSVEKTPQKYKSIRYL